MKKKTLMVLALAAMMALYLGGSLGDGVLTCRRDGRPYTLMDDASVLAFFAAHANADARTLTKRFLSNETFFGQDLTQVPGLEAYVGDALESVERLGMRQALTERFGG